MNNIYTLVYREGSTDAVPRVLYTTNMKKADAIQAIVGALSTILFKIKDKRPDIRLELHFTLTGNYCQLYLAIKDRDLAMEGELVREHIRSDEAFVYISHTYLYKKGFL